MRVTRIWPAAVPAPATARQLLEHVFDQHSAAGELRSLLHELEQGRFRLLTDNRHIREIHHQPPFLKALLRAAPPLPEFPEPWLDQLSLEHQLPVASCFNG